MKSPRLADMAVIGAATIGVTILVLTWSHVDPVEATAEVALPAVIGSMLDDYHPVDAIREAKPDDFDASADYCWDRYLTLSSFYRNAAARADSLEHEIYSLMGRLADLEQGVERPEVVQ